MTEATDDVVRVRPYRGGEEDVALEAIRESLVELGPFMPWAHPEIARKDIEEWIEHATTSCEAGTAFEYVIEDASTGRFLGGVGLNSFDKTNRRANLGYWVRSSETGRGVGSRSAALMAQLGLTVFGFCRVEIFAAVSNVGSIAVMESIGARREGILRNRLQLPGGVSDAVMYSLIDPSEIVFRS